MKIETTPDPSKAKALIAMSNTTFERLQESDQEKYPSNTLIDYYDIIHKLLDAITCKEGITFKGEGAHQQLIDYVCENHFGEKERIFLQDLRDSRNKIQYQGFIISSSFIASHSKQINAIIKKLLFILE